MIAVLQAGVLTERVIRLDVIGCVEDEEDGCAVIDAQFEPPVGDLCFGHVAQLAILLLVACQVVHGVIYIAELVDQIVGHLVEVAEGVHVVVARGSKLEHARVAGEGDRVDGPEHVLS